MGEIRVFLGRCDAYEPDMILPILRRGLEAIGWDRPFTGRITVKPNGVMAHHVHARSCYTRPEFLRAVARLLRSAYPSEGAGSPGPGPQRPDVRLVEKCGVGQSTARVMLRAGWTVLRGEGMRLVAAEEAPKVKVRLTTGVVHQEVTVARDMVDRDLLVFTPKLKSNVLSHGMTAALKLNVGTLDDRERMYRHHYDLDDKIVDMLEIARPDLILTDAIEIGVGGNQMTEPGFSLGAVVVADNPLAHDMVTSQILGLDPLGIGHIKRAVQRGYGPAHPDEVTVVGDTTIAELRSKTAHLNLGFMRVDQFPSPIRVVSGTPYCTGGCQGVLLDWLHMLRDRKPEYMKRLKAFTIVVGEVEEDVGRPAVLIGDCAAKSPKLASRGLPCIRGCPPTHRSIILGLALTRFVVGPLIRPDLVFDSYFHRPLRLAWARRHGRPASWEDTRR